MNVTRGAMVPISRRVRAYFSPVNRENGAVFVFDPGKYGRFDLQNPPAPWVSLGWIDSFQRFSETPIEVLRTGPQGRTQTQYRGVLGGRLEFEFREWGKLQMALASGSEHMNVLAPDVGAAPVPTGGTPTGPIAVLPESNASEIVVGPSVQTAFSIGDLVAVDADYQEQTGYVGSGISAAFVRDPADVNHDRDYIRRVTFNLGRVVDITATSLILAQPLPGGIPSNGSSVQKVIAFVDRDGGSFFAEWSGLFVAEEESGGRVCFYYPRLQPCIPKSGTTGWQREREVEIARPLGFWALSAAFTALPYRDSCDGQHVLCYRSYFPTSMAAVY